MRKFITSVFAHCKNASKSKIVCDLNIYNIPKSCMTNLPEIHKIFSESKFKIIHSKISNDDPKKDDVHLTFTADLSDFKTSEN